VTTNEGRGVAVKFRPGRWSDLLRPLEVLRMTVIVTVGAYLLVGGMMIYACAVHP
jgi:hypothetical protein